METTRFERGEIVYLTAEVRGGGRIHEIGARAEVRAVSGTVLELALGPESETALCQARHVLRASERRARMQTPSGRWPLGASSRPYPRIAGERVAELHASRRPIVSPGLAPARVAA